MVGSHLDKMKDLVEHIEIKNIEAFPFKPNKYKMNKKSRWLKKTLINVDGVKVYATTNKK